MLLEQDFIMINTSSQPGSFILCILQANIQMTYVQPMADYFGNTDLVGRKSIVYYLVINQMLKFCIHV